MVCGSAFKIIITVSISARMVMRSGVYCTLIGFKMKARDQHFAGRQPRAHRSGAL